MATILVVDDDLGIHDFFRRAFWEPNVTVRATAAAYAEPLLRSLDAIHLATAQLLAGEPGAAMEAFVCGR